MKELIKKDYLEVTRSKKILAIIVAFAFIALASPILAKLLPEIFSNIDFGSGVKFEIPEATVNDAIDQYFKNLSQIGVLVLIFISAGSVVEEKTRRNLEILLTKPVLRSDFILSKHIFYSGVSVVIFLIASVLFYLYTTSLFVQPDITNFSLVILVTSLYMVSIITLTILSSVVSKNVITAIALGFLVYFIFGTVFGLIPNISDYSPAYILSNYKDLMLNGWSNKFLVTSIVNVLISVIAVVSSIYIFKNQEVER